jgi:hypothetical protein
MTVFSAARAAASVGGWELTAPCRSALGIDERHKSPAVITEYGRLAGVLQRLKKEF